jgi:hypothetical protein
VDEHRITQFHARNTNKKPDGEKKNKGKERADPIAGPSNVQAPAHPFSIPSSAQPRIPANPNIDLFGQGRLFRADEHYNCYSIAERRKIVDTFETWVNLVFRGFDWTLTELAHERERLDRLEEAEENEEGSEDAEGEANEHEN